MSGRVIFYNVEVNTEMCFYTVKLSLHDVSIL